MRKYAAAQVPMYAGYDWLSVALILVSWYTATAGYAVSAHLPPTAGLALLLSAVLCGRGAAFWGGCTHPEDHVQDRPPLLCPLRQALQS